ncbi:hypothetical protein SH668x_001264 [Planctomicrobium sp. SH668]|uniref:hypothetical protein n=1 Tax=Planctomicrobium sp. SH668 TaxID=3448126 RepID=UPI003F5B44EA
MQFSDSYRYWDHSELATVTLNQIWNPDTQQKSSRTVECVPVCRVSESDDSPSEQGLNIFGQSQYLVIAAEPLCGEVMFKGDVVQIGEEVWILAGDAQRIGAGSLMSHYRSLCKLQRG